MDFETKEQDDAIKRCYDAQKATADEILTEPDLNEWFCAEVNSLLPSGKGFTLIDLNKRLLRLRKIGEEKGGLRRKRRGYRGRNGKGLDE